MANSSPEHASMIEQQNKPVIHVSEQSDFQLFPKYYKPNLKTPIMQNSMSKSIDD